MLSIVAAIAGIIGMFELIIMAGGIGLFSIVLTVKNKMINRKAAIGLMIAFYGIPTFLWLVKTKITNKNESTAILFLGITIFLILAVTGYIIGEIVFRKKILKLINNNPWKNFNPTVETKELERQ